MKTRFAVITALVVASGCATPVPPTLPAPAPPIALAAENVGAPAGPLSSSADASALEPAAPPRFDYLKLACTTATKAWSRTAAETSQSPPCASVGDLLARPHDLVLGRSMRVAGRVGARAYNRGIDPYLTTTVLFEGAGERDAGVELGLPRHEADAALVEAVRGCDSVFAELDGVLRERVRENGGTWCREELASGHVIDDAWCPRFDRLLVLEKWTLHRVLRGSAESSCGAPASESASNNAPAAPEPPEAPRRFDYLSLACSAEWRTASGTPPSTPCTRVEDLLGRYRNAHRNAIVGRRTRLVGHVGVVEDFGGGLSHRKRTGLFGDDGPDRITTCDWAPCPGVELGLPRRPGDGPLVEAARGCDAFAEVEGVLRESVRDRGRVQCKKRLANGDLEDAVCPHYEYIPVLEDWTLRRLVRGSCDSPPPPRLDLDREAASEALRRAAGSIATCARPEGPTGVGHVTVTFAPDGSARRAVADAPFDGTVVGGCVAAICRGLHDPGFAPPAALVRGSLFTE